MTQLPFLQKEIPFTKTEQKIISYILENPSDFIRLSIGETARRLGSSEPTLSRFARHAGYKDFKGLKDAVSRCQEGDDSPAGKMTSSISRLDRTTLQGMLQYQQFCLEKTAAFLDPDRIDAAVDAILQAETIYIYAKGAAVSMAELLRFRLNRFGLRMVSLPAGSSELFETMNFITGRDLLILFGFQKLPRECRVLLDYQKEAGCPSLLFTSRLMPEGELPGSCITLYVYRGEPSEYHSMAAAAAYIDGLVLMTAARMGDGATRQLDRLHQLKERYRGDIPR